MFALPAWWYSNRGYPRSNEARSSCRTDTNSVIKAEPEVFGFHTPSGGKGIFQSTTPCPAKNILLAGACKSSPRVDGCRRAFCWNSMWRNLQRHEVIESSGEVNWLIDGPCGERLPAIDLAHVDLTGGEQRPEQHGGSLC